MPEKHATPRSHPPRPENLADTPVVRLRIDGGNSEERYDLYFEVSRGGVVRCRMSCRMTKRRVRERMSRLEPPDVENLVLTLNPTKLRQIGARQARGKRKAISPCSLIGKLEVWDGRGLVEVTFMADEGQAVQARYTTPPDVKKAVETIYDVAAKTMGLEGAAAIRP
jgi:hypothetical protein